MKPLPRWIPILRRTLLGIAVAATVLAAAVVEENVRGEADWQRFHKERAASGMPLTLAYFVAPPIPDDQNLFRAPPIAPFFEADDGTGAAWLAYQKRMPIPFYGPKAAGSPQLVAWSSWQIGRPVDLSPVLAAIPGAGSPPQNPREVAQAFLQRLSPLKADLDQLAAAASWRTGSQLPFYPDSPIIRNSFAALRSFSFLLSWRASAEVALGQNEQAFADTLAALRLADGCQHSPIMIYAGFGQALLRLSIQPLWDGWVHGTWSKPQLRAFQSAVAPFHTYLEVGQFVGATAGATAEEFADLWPKNRWMIPTGWKKEAAIALLRKGDANALRALDTKHQPLTVANLEREFVMSDAELQAFPLGWMGEPGTSLPMGRAFLFNFATGQTAWQLADVACALRRFQRDTGKYPTELAALVPNYLPEIPFDYMDGNRLRYHPTPEGSFVLYSIGSDGKDNDGALPTRFERNGPWMAGADGDWSWPTQVTPPAPAHS